MRVDNGNKAGAEQVVLQCVVAGLVFLLHLHKLAE